MDRLQPRATVAAPVAAFALAAGAAVSFAVGDAVGILSDGAEKVFVVTWLLGWVLLAWATIVGGGYAVLLGSRLVTRRPVSPLEAALAAASLMLIAAVLAAYPAWGTGSAVGSGPAVPRLAVHR